jgi:hypothetical protein
MTHYRDDLSSAHARIAHLERALADAERKRAAPEAEEEIHLPSLRGDSAPSSGRVRFWHAWPIPILFAAVATYAVRFGATLPTSIAEFYPLERASLLCAAASALMMLLALVLRLRAAGASGPGQRLLAAVAALVSAPLLLAAALAIFRIGSIVLCVVAGVCAVIGAVVWLVSWIRHGTT